MHFLALTPNGGDIQGLHRRLGLALHVAEGGEVVVADQRLGGLVHGVRVERLAHRPDAAVIQSGRRLAIEDAVEVAALHGREAGVPVVGNLNGVEHGPFPGLGQDEFLVNDTVDRLTLLGIEGRGAVHPTNGSACAIVCDTKGQAATCRQAGLTTSGPRRHLVLTLSSEIRLAAARFQTDEVTQNQLDSLGESFPDLVRMALERYTLPQISLLLRELLAEEISIRDLRSILESLLSIGGTTDVDLSRFIVFFANTDSLCPAVAARDDAGRPAEAAQPADDGDGGGRLAGAAGDQVADHQHRHRQTLHAPPAGAVRVAAHGDRGMEQ